MLGGFRIDYSEQDSGADGKKRNDKYKRNREGDR